MKRNFIWHAEQPIAADLDQNGSIEVIVADGSRVATLKGHSGSIHSLAWHPKNGQLATGGFDGMVRVYEIPSGKLVKEFMPVTLAPKKQVAAAKAGN